MRQFSQAARRSGLLTDISTVAAGWNPSQNARRKTLINVGKNLAKEVVTMKRRF
jgi:hypothetical protein